MKTVCIVGAGPAGLVAAKTFLQTGNYVVTVIEAADRVGGMWRGQTGDYGDKCSPEMKTNLSRFTVAFADLSWSSVDLSDPKTGCPSPATPPMFPKAWQVGRYLEAYAKKFGLEDNILLDKRVVSAKITSDMEAWEIVCEDVTTGHQVTQHYNYLIVASGFFDKPSHSFDPSKDKDFTNIQHSSHFRHISSLTDKPGKIVVVGGGISGSEAAAQAAFQISDANNLPSDTKPVHAGSKVYHIINRPFYSLPRYLPQDPYDATIQDFNLSPKFLPLDLVLYNLSRRGKGEISAAISLVPPEKAKKGHEFMRSVLGGDQREVGHSELVYKQDQTQYPGYTGITDTYTEFVRSGVIVPVRGWVDEVQQQADAYTGESNGSFNITLKKYEPWYYASWEESTGIGGVDDVVAIIEATGYKNSLDYLTKNVEHDWLGYDPHCSRIPFLLTRGSILSPVPNLAFVGFYEGPYWGVMEMQARFIVDTWPKYSSPDDVPHATDTTIFRRHDAGLIRHRMQFHSEQRLQIPQFWMSDYVGLVEELARKVGVTRDDSAFGGQVGPAFASRYQGPGTDPEAAAVVQEVAALVKASNEDAKFVAAAVFRAMQGVWTLHRKIESRNASAPGGIFAGTAHFHPRTPTDSAYIAEYLYIEEGTFTMNTGYAFPTTRRYVYRYNETTDKITAWFADEDKLSTASLFNTWDFYAPDDKQHGWMAKGHHWCDPDTYKNTCEFRFRGASLKTFGITYEVEGPNKDYSHESWYERPVVEYK